MKSHSEKTEISVNNDRGINFMLGDLFSNCVDKEKRDITLESDNANWR